MSEASWHITHKGEKVLHTTALSEQGAWNALTKALPNLKKFSQRDLKSFGYTAKREKK